MFNVGGGEMIMLGILALLVFGPEGLPSVIKSVMRTVRALRSAASDFQHEVKSALDDENIRQDQAKRKRAPMEPAAESLEEGTGTELDVPDPAQPETEPEPDTEPLDSEPTSEPEAAEEPNPEDLADETAENSETQSEATTDLYPDTKEFLYGEDGEEQAKEDSEPADDSSEQDEDEDDDGPGLPMRTAKERAAD